MPDVPNASGSVALPEGISDSVTALDVALMFCHQCVEGAKVDVASVMLLAPGGVWQLVATSDESPRMLELMQIQVSDESRIDRDEQGAFVNRELKATDGKYPHFSPRALAQGFASMHVLPLRYQNRVVGVVSLLATHVRGLDEHDLVWLQHMADIAALAIINARTAVEAQRLSAQLNAALQSRVVIEQAKGIVSQFTNGSIDEAFRQIRLYARNSNLGLSAVAGAVINGSLKASTIFDQNIRISATKGHKKGTRPARER